MDCAEEHQKLYGDPEKIVHYMDYTENPPVDNSRYIPDLVPGVLQPLKILDDDPVVDNLISKMDIEKIAQESEQLTAGVQEKVQKDMQCFPEPHNKELLVKYRKKKFAPSTKKKALWAARIFEQWKCICNYKIKQQGTNLDNMIMTILMNMDIPQMSDVLSFFLMEIRKQNGDEYPHETLYKIVLSLQHYMTMNGRDLKLLDYPGLVKMRNTLDNWMKELSKEGVICERQQSKPISVQDKDHLWDTGLLSDNTPEKLVNTLLYLIGVHFALHACDEHKALKVRAYSQFKIKVDQESNRRYLEYMEKHSKTFQGGIQQLRDKPKVVHAFKNIEQPEWCIVHIFKTYLVKKTISGPKVL